MQRTLPHPPSASPAALVAAVLVLAACADAPAAPDRSAERPALERAGQGLTQGQEPELEPEAHAIARAVPGFGGLFVDSSGAPVIYLTDRRHRALAEGAAAARIREVGHDPARLRVRDADYDYLQLDQWFRALAPAVLVTPGVAFVDLDERRNRVYVGVEHGAGAAHAGVAAALARLGIPRQAVVVGETAPVRSMSSLTSEVRPVVGGVKISRYFYGCTLGFNTGGGRVANATVRDQRRSFVTASHCTETPGETDGSWFSQPFGNGTNPTGTEVYDPPAFLCSSISLGSSVPLIGRCRYSDAARFVYASEVPMTLGGIARTTERARYVGALTIADTFHVAAERANPVQGTRAHKVGMTTGWTYGEIGRTCVHIRRSPDGLVLLCQSLVNAGARWGDSGSPVFEWSGSGDRVTLLGLLWGGDVEAEVYAFSPMSGIQRELGPLVTY